LRVYTLQGSFAAILPVVSHVAIDSIYSVQKRQAVEFPTSP
jgi:hypothetical protein